MHTALNSCKLQTGNFASLFSFYDESDVEATASVNYFKSLRKIKIENISSTYHDNILISTQ